MPSSKPLKLRHFKPELRTICLLVCWVPFGYQKKKKARNAGYALLAAPSTGLHEYLRIVSAREIS